MDRGADKMSALLRLHWAVANAFFDENGYSIARAVFSPSEVSDLELDFDRIVAQISASGEDINATWKGPEMDKMGAAGSIVLHTHNVQQYSAVWNRAFLNESFLDAAEEILGPNIVLHHSKLFQKPGEKGAPFPMHQDWGYFPTLKDTMVGAIIHVSRATDQMGCLRVYPGSHKLGRLEGAMGGTDVLLSDYPIEGATPLEAEPGDVVFFHYFTIHGSMPNRSTDVRKTVLVQLHSGDDDVEPGNTHPNERLCLRGWNNAMTREAANRGF